MRRFTAVLSGVAVFAASAALTLPARAAEIAEDSGSVGVTVQIEPLQPGTGVVPGTGPGTGALPATGMPSMEPILWVAAVLLALGVALALRGAVTRRRRMVIGAAAPLVTASPILATVGAVPVVGRSAEAASSVGRAGPGGDA